MQHQNEQIRNEITYLLTDYFNQHGIEVRLAANDNLPAAPVAVFEQFITTPLRQPDLWHLQLMVRLLGVPDISGQITNGIHQLLLCWQPSLPSITTLLFQLHVMPTPHIKGRVFFAEWVAEEGMLLAEA